VPQIGEFASGVQEISKLGETGFISLFRIGVFTSFNCALVTTQDIYIVGVQEIGEFASGVWETSKLSETGLIWLFRIKVFT
jgi:hypothetical protein